MGDLTLHSPAADKACKWMYRDAVPPGWILSTPTTRMAFNSQPPDPTHSTPGLAWSRTWRASTDGQTDTGLCRDRAALPGPSLNCKSRRVPALDEMHWLHLLLRRLPALLLQHQCPAEREMLSREVGEGWDSDPAVHCPAVLISGATAGMLWDAGKAASALGDTKRHQFSSCNARDHFST